MTIGIVIPWDTEEPIYSRTFDNLTEYQDAVGGYIEHVELTDPSPAGMFVDEEGMLKKAEFNARASLLLMVHNPAFLWHGANILGTAVLIGPTDDEGNTLDAPDPFIKILLHTREYKVEVQTADDKEAWNFNQRRFADVQDAYEYGVNLAYRWAAVERVRVSPA